MSGFKFHNKNILIISPESWDFVKVSKHHYAWTLAKMENKVFFLNPPAPNIKGVKINQTAENLYIIDYHEPFKGVRFLPKAIRKVLFRKVYKRFEQEAGLKFDAVFLFENSRFYDLDFLPKKIVSIYFQVDEDQNFHPKRAAKSANLVLAINDIIQEILTSFRNPVFKLSHAFSGNFSQSSIDLWKGETNYIPTNTKLKAFYVGNLDHGFNNVELVGKLVNELSFIDFVFIGPYNKSEQFYRLICDCENVQLMGQVPAESIPALLDKADLLFFAYRDDFLSSSHKVMEYLAAGKAIVTTKVQGYPEDPDLFYCSGTAEKFIDLFREVCENIQNANNPEKIKKRIQFAMDNTYGARIEQIESLINNISSN